MLVEAGAPVRIGRSHNMVFLVRHVEIVSALVIELLPTVAARSLRDEMAPSCLGALVAAANAVLTDVVGPLLTNFFFVYWRDKRRARLRANPVLVVILLDLRPIVFFNNRILGRHLLVRGDLECFSLGLRSAGVFLARPLALVMFFLFFNHELVIAVHAFILLDLHLVLKLGSVVKALQFFLGLVRCQL